MKETAAGGIGATLAGLLTTFISSTPLLVKNLSLVGLAFFLCDYLTGVAAAAARGELSSKEARTKYFAKSMQFFGILTLGTGAAVVTNSWAWMIATLAAICSMETISIIENIRGLQKAGVSLGPIAPLLDRFAKVFGEVADPVESGRQSPRPSESPYHTVSPAGNLDAQTTKPDHDTTP